MEVVYFDQKAVEILISTVDKILMEHQKALPLLEKPKADQRYLSLQLVELIHLDLMKQLVLDSLLTRLRKRSPLEIED
jgi:hypothetical protein